MFVEDLKLDFYSKLVGQQRVLVLVHADVDAVCACRVLLDLLRCDGVAHSPVLVESAEELAAAYAEHAELRTCVLINCGGALDLVELLQPPEDAVLFVLDAHKPSHVCNVYSDGQVRLVTRDPEEDVPDFEDIFRDDDEQLDASDNEDSAADAAERRRERRAWEQRRHTLMFNYTQFSYHGKPSACVLVELAWRLGRAGTQAVWAGAVAAEAARALSLRAPARVLLDTAPLLQQHVARLAHAVDPRAAPLLALERDAALPLYRDWALEAAVRHAPALAPRLRLHAPQGEASVRRLLADMGFPLRQAREAFRAADVALRRALPAALDAACSKRGLARADVVRDVHVLRRPLAPALSALDAVYILMALLERSESGAARLEHCLCALSVEEAGGAGAAAAHGAEAARGRLRSVAQAVAAARAHRHIHNAGPFHYLVLPESAELGRPLWLCEAARWAAAGGAARGGARPLLACARSAAQPDMCLVVGLPPRHEEEPRNLLGAAFSQAAAESGCDGGARLCHPGAVLVPFARRTHFLDALTKLLD